MLLSQARTPRAKRAAAFFERALFAMVANRCLSPYSKLYCWEQWLREEVFLPSASLLALHQLYLAMDFLEEHKAEVEKAIYFKMADLMNADVDVIFYDTTSLHFEVDEEDEVEQRKQGRKYEDLALGYKQLLRVEHCWRQMKSGLRCDPSFTSGLGGSRLMSRSPCSLCSSNASPRSAPARPGATSWGRCLPLVRGR